MDVSPAGAQSEIRDGVCRIAGPADALDALHRQLDDSDSASAQLIREVCRL